MSKISLLNLFRKKVSDNENKNIIPLEDFQYTKELIDKSYIQIETSSKNVIINKIGEGYREPHKLYQGINIVQNFDNGFYFTDYTNQDDIVRIYLRNYDTSKITTMKCMFLNLPTLEIDVSHFDTSNVVNMCSMFERCNYVTELELGKFNTSHVTDMSHMFYECKNLKKVNINSFDTTNVQDMSSMFKDCFNLTNLDLSSFKLDNIRYICDFLKGCYNLKSLDISNFDFSKNQPTTYGHMFYGCTDLTYIRCNKSFYEWCMKHEDEICLPYNMTKNGKGLWDIIDEY